MIRTYEEQFTQELANLKERVAKLKTREGGHFIGGMPLYYQRVAELGILAKKDISEVKNYLFKAGRVAELQFLIAKNEIIPTGWTPTYKPLFNRTPYEDFVNVILSDNLSLLTSFSQAADYVGGLEVVGTCNYHLAYSLKSLLLGQDGLAQDHLQQAHQVYKPRIDSTAKGRLAVLSGIVENKLQLIEEGIQAEIKSHFKWEKGSMFEDISLSVTALMKLANIYSFKPNIDSPLLIKDLLSDHKPATYTDIADVYAATGYSLPTESFFSKVRSYFAK